MKNLTVAEMRKRQLNNFNDRCVNDFKKAQKIYNSYIRLCALSGKICEMQNDVRWCDSEYLKEKEEQEQRWIRRLNDWLSPYRLSIAYAGIYPTISVLDGNCIASNEVYYIAY